MNLINFFTSDSKQRGYCDSNHLYIRINDNIDYPLSKMSPKSLGTFIHEYIHYIQHLTTTYGILSCNVYNAYFKECIDYFRNDQTEIIKIPISLLSRNPKIEEYNTRFQSIGGTRNSSLSFKDKNIIIDDNELASAKSNNKGVKVILEDKETSHQESFEFGYYCVIESMAHMVQSYFDTPKEHDEIPYLAIQNIISSIFPEIKDNNELLISLALCSLEFDNPGVAFIDLIDDVKRTKNYGGLSFYTKFMQGSKIIHNEKTVSLAQRKKELLLDFKVRLEETIGNNIIYYSEIFDRIIKHSESGSNYLLELINDKKLTQDFGEKLVYHYGMPYVEGDNMTIMKPDEQGELFLEIALIRSFYLLMQRFSPQKGEDGKVIQECPHLNICKAINDKALREPESIDESKIPDMDRNCYREQWNKQGKDCFFTQSLKYFGLKEKEIKIVSNY